MKFRNIEILESDSNKKGDLFGRLMSDLFHTLGYNEPRLNIHKAGREIDLNAIHRTERKIAIAECKAHADTIGGSDINKFVGTIDAEKRKIEKDNIYRGHDVVGYFVSLSGFKETAVEQENDLNNERVILIKADKIVEELIKGKILVSTDKAVASIPKSDLELSLMEHSDLLAYDKGWVWALYFSDVHGQKPSHFALVHAEGKILVRELAEEIIAIDKSLKKLFQGLTLINKEKAQNIINENLNEAKNKYFKFLENELGEIHFEGLPTDKESGSVKVKLENIFVPLHLKRKDEFNNQIAREGIGTILKEKSRLAILAKPGAGKSTLIKRIAIAYAFPERRKQINDSLPDKTWFPIFLRCRELGNKVTLSITEIINGIPARAEIYSCADSFSILVSKSLQNGEALLLIDGLDEIVEDKSRVTFVNQLRTFIATYPKINIIITSREAGFRIVGGSLATYCENYVVSNLNNSEIEQLCLKWHQAIIDDSETTIKDAIKLSELILRDNRIRVLAENPLLLTTLLFVKRWAGYLPTKKSILYQEMIKLLLVTWNVEGHEILDIEEAEPQLAFVAYWMTKNRKQTISADELHSCLINARKQMPEILGYTNVSPAEFIKMVEFRSSLLIMSGHKQLGSGNITAVYEFLHLSFQEYLTAKAIVKKFLPSHDSSMEILDIVKPNINNENWKEVIPLIAVLLERDAKDLVIYLINESKTIASKKAGNEWNEFIPPLLGSCLANEVQINPILLEDAIEWYVKSVAGFDAKRINEIILKNKFGLSFRKKIRQCFFGEFDDVYSHDLGSTLGEIYLTDLGFHNKSLILKSILASLESQEKEDKCIAILGMMTYSYDVFRPSKEENIHVIIFEQIFTKMIKCLTLEDFHFHFSICWCIAWAVEIDIFPETLSVILSNYLINTWGKFNSYNLQRVTSWTLSKILIPTQPKLEIIKIKETIKKTFQNPDNEFDQITALYLGTIIGETYDKTDVVKIFRLHFGHSDDDILQHSNSFLLFLDALDIKLEDIKIKPKSNEVTSDENLV